MKRNIMNSTLPERKIRICFLWHNKNVMNQLKSLKGKMPNSMVSECCTVIELDMNDNNFFCYLLVQITDMQRNLDAFRLDRLTYESARQNCTNQLAMCKMKFGQLQGEFQQMSTKLKVHSRVHNIVAPPPPPLPPIL